MHLSDSKTDYNSKKDYHQNIGLYVLPTEIQIYWLFCLLLFLAEVILESPPSNTYSKTHDAKYSTHYLKQPKEVWGKEIEALQALTLWGDGSRGQLAGYVVPSDRYDKTWLFWSLKEGWCFWMVSLNAVVKTMSIWCPNYPCKRRFWRCGTFDLPLTFERRSSTIIWCTRRFLIFRRSSSIRPMKRTWRNIF